MYMFFLIEDIEDPFQLPFDYYNLPYVFVLKCTLTRKIATYCNVSYKPEWGSVEITRAMVTLVEESLASCNSPSMRLCFASESCIPILPLHQTIESLWSTNTSWIDVKRKPRNGYNGSAQWVPIEKTPLIPAECVCKSDQWICLTRQHAERIASLPSSIDHTNLWEAFRKCCPVRGISLKLQEEEREKKLDYVPDVSFIEQDSIEVDQDTKDLLTHLNIDLPNVSVASNNYQSWKKSGKGGKHRK